MAVEIRAVESLAEAKRILPMYEWLFGPPGRQPPMWDAARAKGALEEAIASTEARVLVAEDVGEPVGFLTAYLELNSVRFGKRCWVEDIAVHPERRSEGIGGRLLDAAEDWARERGATHFELDTGLAREDAQRFYEHREPATKGYSYSWLL